MQGIEITQLVLIFKAPKDLGQKCLSHYGYAQLLKSTEGPFEDSCMIQGCKLNFSERFHSLRATQEKAIPFPIPRRCPWCLLSDMARDCDVKVLD